MASLCRKNNQLNKTIQHQAKRRGAFFMRKKEAVSVAKLSDRQRKQIITEYVAGDGRVSQRSLAKKYNVCLSTISKILRDEKVEQKCTHKKEENTRSMLEFLDEQKDKAQSLMQQLLNASEKDIKKASLRDKMGALKILSEVFAPQKWLNGLPQVLKKLRVVYWLYNVAVRAARNGRLLLYMNKEGVYAVIV